VAAVGVGKLADRLDRIKPFVLGAGVLGALSLAMPLTAPSVNGMIAFNVVNGISAWGYSALFPLCAAIALTGAVAVVFVKSVR
jgi:hypothetical protein